MKEVGLKVVARITRRETGYSVGQALTALGEVLTIFEDPEGLDYRITALDIELKRQAVAGWYAEAQFDLLTDEDEAVPEVEA